MPNKNIYVADEDMQIFQRAQEVAGESISKVIVQALRQYLVQKDLEGTEFKECEAMKGIYRNGLSIEKARFIGKHLSTMTIGEPDDTKMFTYDLYTTRKGKFLLQSQVWYADDPEIGVSYDFEVIEDFSKLYTRGLPSKLIKDAEEQLGKSHIRFLDI
ncbi:hypothetical protein [Geomonas agri]|uniref:hypothetical protein n=1 Tax=Geomonas agri TaxID=2873702 RepID=UPI001CD45D3A|nr:hypothetical protein [Geomonas agri]